MVSVELHSLLLREREEGRMVTDTDWSIIKADILTSDWSVKMEPETDLQNSDQEGAGAISDDHEDYNVPDLPKEEPIVKERKLRVGKKRGRPKKRKPSESCSSGGEWYEGKKEESPIVFKESEGEDNEDENNDTTIKRCNKCGRPIKGHPLPRHSNCELNGVDEEGISIIQALKMQSKIMKKKREDKRREKLTAEKCYSTGFIKLPCDNLSCEVCEIAAFNSELAVLTHVRKEHGPKEQLVCEVEGCKGKAFKSFGALHYHQIKCHDEKAPCDECGSTDYITLNNHMQSKHPRPCSPKSCDQCGKVFTNWRKFKHHIDRVHTNSDMPILHGTNKWAIAKMMTDYENECHCNLELKSKQAKLNHFKLVHLDYKQCPKCDKIVQELNVGHHKCEKKNQWQPLLEFICEHCGKSFKSQGGKHYHIDNVHMKSTAECHICFKSCTKTTLSAHMAIHKPKTPCKICGKMVGRMREHVEAMHQVNLPGLTMVMLYFQEEIDMKNKCDSCGKGFPTCQKLKDHTMSVHLKLRPYKCRYTG